MSTCPSAPPILNGKILNQTNLTAEYECQSGFYMTGIKIINCTAGAWPTTPTCEVIRLYDDVTVFPDWWFYVLAAILGCLVLACLLCICCWWCCGRPSNSVQPYERYSTANDCCACPNGCGRWCCTGSRGCCRGRATDLSDTEDSRRYHTIRSSPVENGGVYFLPSNRAIEGSRGFYVIGANGLPRIHVKDEATNTDKKERKVTHEPHQRSHSPAYIDHLDTATETIPIHGTAPSNTWHKNHSTTHRDSKFWKEMANSETRSEEEMSEQTSKSKKPAREVKAWLPHSNPVRNNHNTSTK